MNLRVGKNRNTRYVFSDCFALPTVLIASIIMISVLVSTVVMVSSTSIALKTQYSNIQARLASEAGEVYAKSCLDANNGISGWTNDTPLKPWTDCLGADIVVCPGDDVLCSISANNNNKEKSVFSIGVDNSQTPNRWKQISMGASHACALSYDDKLYCWGQNSLGQLGDGTTIKRLIPVAVNTNSALKDKTVVSITTGALHTCVITSESTNNVYCWGGNSKGELGINSQTEKHMPTQIDFSGVLSGKKIISISAGYWHTCAISSEAINNAYCWGWNTDGQLGDNSAIDRFAPVSVYRSAGSSLEGKTVIAISTGDVTYNGFDSFTCAITSEAVNNAYCWGENYEGQLGDNSTVNRQIPVPVYRATGSALDGKKVVSISTGDYHVCVITSEIINNAYCWGRNGEGQLGDGTTDRRVFPVPVYRISGSELDGKQVISISAGNSFLFDGHTCAVTSEAINNTYCWGGNWYGQLGDNNTASRNIPTPVYRTTNSALDGKTVVEISAGSNSTCAIIGDTTNNAYCWGSNSSGQIGDYHYAAYSKIPIAVNTSASYINSLRVIGSVNQLRFDDNIWHQINQSTRRDSSIQLSEYQIGMQLIDTGEGNTCGINSTNNAYCWGFNSIGQLGDNSTVNRFTPVSVYQTTGSALDGKTVVGISASIYHACAITSETTNNAYCWGENGSGQLGNYSTVDSKIPVPVYRTTGSALDNKMVTAISTGFSHTCAITSEAADNVYCWGSNHYGQIGDNTYNADRSRPTPIYRTTGSALDGKKVTAISAGEYHTCVITSEASNNAYCWGSDGNGQLGDGTASTRIIIPTPIYRTTGSALDGKKVTAISAGLYHTCAITSEGTSNAYCWGFNSSGQLGDNTTINHIIPASIYRTAGSALDGKKVTAISSASMHTCAITSEASNNAYCWGYNGFGELGDKTHVNKPYPVPVYRTAGSALDGKTVTAISASGANGTPGGSHSCAIANQSAYCWGYNGNGRLGINSLSDSNIPVLVFRAVTNTRYTRY